MRFTLTPEQLEIREAVARLCERFGDDYWLKKDSEGEFPHEFHRAMAEGGWLGVAMPEEFGGSGLGITEAAVVMQTVAQSGAGFSGASAVHMNIFGLHPVVMFGTAEQKQRFLPPLIAGREKACFAVTEPDVGLDTTRLKTRAVRDGNGYSISGRKIWTSTGQVAEKMLILTRTTPFEEASRPSHGMTLFYTDLDRSKVEVREIHKMGRAAVDSNMVFIDGLKVPAEDRIGEEGKGFQYILHGMNPERILLASEAVGLGRAALARAARYAKERVVFGRPIGQNQGIQHPLAERWIDLEAAELLVWRAAAAYDSGAEPGAVGAFANAAKFFAAEAGHRACETAMLTHGGMGYAREFHVERFFREIQIARIAPISPQLILSHIAERVLGLPKSY
ncbi:MAG TPA: acyl-CoA dehydrogenase family protein [Stellaceae bacterium]|jgi:acyl-CoA dehydrogenase|nr:acyl-CoA dehydrogenase family protein [Stellaceae bacterium]